MQCEGSKIPPTFLDGSRDNATYDQNTACDYKKIDALDFYGILSAVRHTKNIKKNKSGSAQRKVVFVGALLVMESVPGN